MRARTRAHPPRRALVRDKLILERATSSRRTVGARAAARHGVGLAELMRAGLLLADDALSFAYGGRVHTAALTADARIACGGDGAASGGAAATSYSAPTHWALACVDAYWRAAHAGTRPTTNPSGYTRVRSVRHGCTLNALRDRFLGLAAVAAPSAPPPEPALPAPKRRRLMAPPAPVAPAATTALLAQPESLGEACARRAGAGGGGGAGNRKRGYKALALAMQGEAARFARTVLAHEAALRALAAPPEAGVSAEAQESAYAYARHVYAMTHE